MICSNSVRRRGVHCRGALCVYCVGRLVRRFGACSLLDHFKTRLVNVRLRMHLFGSPTDMIALCRIALHCAVVYHSGVHTKCGLPTTSYQLQTPIPMRALVTYTNAPSCMTQPTLCTHAASWPEPRTQPTPTPALVMQALDGGLHATRHSLIASRQCTGATYHATRSEARPHGVHGAGRPPPAVGVPRHRRHPGRRPGLPRARGDLPGWPGNVVSQSSTCFRASFAEQRGGLQKLHFPSKIIPKSYCGSLTSLRRRRIHASTARRSCRSPGS